MRISLKITCIILAVNLLLIITGNMIFGLFFTNQIIDQENKQIKSNINIIKANLVDKAMKYISMSADWSHWDETYQYILSAYPDYEKQNLTEDSFNSLNINLMIFYDKDFNVINKFDYDIEKGVFTQFPANLAEAIAVSIKQLKQSDNMGCVIKFENDFYIVAASPITDSLKQKPSNGMLAICKRVDERMLADIEQITESHILGYSINDLDNKLASELLQKESSGNLSYAEMIDDKASTMSVYLLLHNSDNSASSVVLTFEKPREIYKSGMEQLRILQAVYSLLIMFIVVILFFIINIFVSNPLRDLANTLKEISLTEKRFKKLPETGKDELTIIKRTINNMLTKISQEQENVKKSEARAIYNSHHDSLTGLYNRRFIDEQMASLDNSENLPISVMIGDINGLKIANDFYGHQIGDTIIKEVAQIIKSKCRSQDIVARWGGDEFIVFLPNSEFAQTQKVVLEIVAECAKMNIGPAEISISLGFDVKREPGEDINIAFKNAEDSMYKNKMIETTSMRGKTINTLLNTLYEKNPREEAHSRRVSDICVSIGTVMGLPDIEISRLKVIGLIHDIGKIAIDEEVLNKPSMLTEDEWAEIKRHPEIGYRILSSTNEILTLAEYILKHHERLDGKGYPNSIEGDKIPLMTRILTIADSFDAMTNERTYKQCLTKEQAILELRKNAGTQFDKEVVEIFIDKVLDKL